MDPAILVQLLQNETRDQRRLCGALLSMQRLDSRLEYLDGVIAAFQRLEPLSCEQLQPQDTAPSCFERHNTSYAPLLRNTNIFRR